MNKRPLSITLISLIFIAGSGAAFLSGLWHLADLKTQPIEFAEIAFVRILAVACGFFMLRGFNWARWLLVVWMAWHIYISLGSSVKLVMHGVIFSVILIFLFRPKTSAYFRGTEAEPAEPEA